MKPEFSELSYAFAYAAELARKLSSNLTVAPSFPSTSVEGTKGYGYDLKLGLSGIPLFLQFKLAHCMIRKDAAEFSSGKFVQGKPVDPVYRFYLMALGKSRQTALMLQLEKRHDLVFYVAPAFHKAQELNKHFIAGSVEKHSRAIRPSRIKKMPDKLEHFVSYRQTGPCFRFSDNPEQLEDSAESIATAIESSEAREITAGALVESMVSVLQEAGEISTPFARDLESTEFGASVSAQYISRTFFGCELLFVQRGRPNNSFKPTPLRGAA